MAANVRYCVGIDLGTSNCAVAFVEPRKGAAGSVVDFPVVQAVRPFEVSARPLLPSVLYLPAEGELAAGSDKLPWADNPSNVVGELGRWHGAKVPSRLVTSAKSWLCHPGVDRQAPILPWGSQGDLSRLSPVAASQGLLSHLRHAWDQAHPDAPLAEQEVVLTVPASFDEGARALTLQAARDAGLNLDKLLLLEEPAAAFYDFTSRHREQLTKALEGVRLVLVVDVGGGTTDFSLIQVALLPEGPSLKRLAVGDHLLLGGDNMDAALARQLEVRLAPSSQFNAAQWAQALQAARIAKETLLGDKPPQRAPVAIAGSGSRMMASTLSTELTRDEVEKWVTEGFFSTVDMDSAPVAAKAGAIVELGLPFAKDASVTRHLVAFLRGHAHAGFTALGAAPSEGGLPRPDALLLNGGVFNSPVLRKRIVEVVSALWPEQPAVRLLNHDSLDLAVARGAAYSALARRALGQRIGGGAPRAYYVAVTQEIPPQGVCLIPRGLDETEVVELKERPFELKLGKPVQLQLYSTTADRLDKAGDLVTLSDGFKALPPLHAVLDGAKGTRVKVHLSAVLSEVGTLALSAIADERRWRLEFELRGTAAQSGAQRIESMPAKFSEAVLAVERVFGNKPLPVTPKDVKQLARTLEQTLGPREQWRLPVLRELWTALFAGASKRRRSADHERVFFHLLGYALRPGVGYPLDAWRAEQTFTLFKDAVQHHAEQASWAEFWILWRRIAGGLNAEAQEQVWNFLAPHLERRVPPSPPPLDKLKGIIPQGLDEMVRTAASMELLEPKSKVRLGEWIVARLNDANTRGGPWTWALGRLGARQPIHGAAHRVVSSDVASEWIHLLLKPTLSQTDGAAFALAQLARKTGDRSRDIDEDLRARVLAHFTQVKAPTSFQQMVSEAVALSAADESRALGDALPLGLTLA